MRGDATLYRIKDWDKHFENNRSRPMQTKFLRWIPMPIKQDGSGYRRVVRGWHGAANLGAWVAIVEVAAKCSPRGTLVMENGVPYTPATLAMKTGIAKRHFRRLIRLLLTPAVDWLEIVKNPRKYAGSQEGAEKRQGSAIEVEGKRKGKEVKSNAEIEELLQTYYEKLNCKLFGSRWRENRLARKDAAFLISVAKDVITGDLSECAVMAAATDCICDERAHRVKSTKGAIVLFGGIIRKMKEDG